MFKHIFDVSADIPGEPTATLGTIEYLNSEHDDVGRVPAAYLLFLMECPTGPVPSRPHVSFLFTGPIPVVITFS